MASVKISAFFFYVFFFKRENRIKVFLFSCQFKRKIYSQPAQKDQDDTRHADSICRKDCGCWVSSSRLFSPSKNYFLQTRIESTFRLQLHDIETKQQGKAGVLLTQGFVTRWRLEPRVSTSARALHPHHFLGKSHWNRRGKVPKLLGTEEPL